VSYLEGSGLERLVPETLDVLRTQGYL